MRHIAGKEVSVELGGVDEADTWEMVSGIGVKSINRMKGYKGNLLTHSGDIRDFKEIIRNAKDPVHKKKYQRILKGRYVSVLVLIVSFMALVLTEMVYNP